MDEQRLTYLFQQYANQNCTAEEMKEFMELINQGGHNEKLEALMDNFWINSPEVEMEKDEANRILESVFSAETTPPKLKPSKLYGWMGWAAALLLCGSLTFLFLNPTPKPAQLAMQKENNSRTVNTTARIITTTTIRDHERVVLPDGSVVILNANSAITYPQTFTGKREVTLKGEGYFDIKHDEKHSFTVFTGKIRTTVLGTAFNIRAYDRDKNVEVTVTRGKVGVLNQQATLGILQPNQQIVFNKQDNSSRIKKVIADNSVSWQGNDLFFNDISMEQAAQILSKRFDTPIAFGSESAKKCTFTATFLKGESLDEILTVICSYNNANYQTRAGGITINGQGCE